MVVHRQQTQQRQHPRDPAMSSSTTARLTARPQESWPSSISMQTGADPAVPLLRRLRPFQKRFLACCSPRWIPMLHGNFQAALVFAAFSTMWPSREARSLPSTEDHVRLTISPTGCGSRLPRRVAVPQQRRPPAELRLPSGQNFHFPAATSKKLPRESGPIASMGRVLK